MHRADGRSKLLETWSQVVRRAEETRRRGLQGADLLQPKPRARLPSWPEEVRAAPNELLRTALWNVRNTHHGRGFLSGELLPGTDRTIRVVQNGPELRQGDFRNFLQVLHLARGRELGGWIDFIPNRLIQNTRVTRSKANGNHKNRLFESLTRLRETEITVRIKRLPTDVTLPLLADFDPQIGADDRQSSSWRIALDPQMALLFGERSFTYLGWRQHLQLPTGLSSWLHGYLASHAEPGPIKISTLQRASGSLTAAPSKFAQLIRAALEDLRKARFLVYAEVRGDLVHVLRTPAALESTFEVAPATYEVGDVAH